MITEAIILAGGLGTRLQSAVSDVPKCMAPIRHKPFLYYVINELQQQGIETFIFSLGYMYEIVESYLSKELSHIPYQLSIENEPLGTGGAIQLACSKAKQENILVVNGDTLFKVNISTLSQFHTQQKAACTIALKPMKNFERYGVVTIDDKGLITSFEEKKYYASGFINGGVYALHIDPFIQRKFSAKFSFEKDYLECTVKEKNIFGCVQDNYFIDIGIPDDYVKAQKDLGVHYI